MTPLRKTLAITAVVLLGLGLVAAGVVGYLWTRATALPEWYTEGDPADYAGEPEAAVGPRAPSRWIALDEQGNPLAHHELDAGAEPEAGPVIAFEPAPAPAGTPRRHYDYEPDHAEPVASARPRRARTGSEPKRHELRGFHRNAKGKANPAVRASRAVYEDGQLEIGVILDLQRLPKDQLKARERARYERAVERFPGIMQRDVWVGVEDEPLSVAGYLALSPEAEVRVGKLRYSLDGAARRLGMTPIELRLELNRALRRLGFVDPEG